MRRVILALMVFALPAPLHAMTVATFMAKWEALEGEGLSMVLSQDFAELEAEIESARLSLREERVAAQLGGRAQAYCPTRGGLTMPQLLSHLSTIPETSRAAMPFREGLKSFLSKKFPCG